MNITYIRVSDIDQNEARQIEAMKKFNIDKEFLEKCSAKNTNRPKLQEMIKFINNFHEFNSQLQEDQRQALTLYIESFSRLARNTIELLEMVEDFQSKGVKIISLKEGFDTSTPTGKLMLTVIGAIGAFEREIMKERQREGIAIAKAQGKYLGRKKVEFPKNWQDVYEKWKHRELTGVEAMSILKLKKTTFYSLVKEYEEEGETERC